MICFECRNPATYFCQCMAGARICQDCFPVHEARPGAHSYLLIGGEDSIEREIERFNQIAGEHAKKINEAYDAVIEELNHHRRALLAHIEEIQERQIAFLMGDQKFSFLPSPETPELISQSMSRISQGQEQEPAPALLCIQNNDLFYFDPESLTFSDPVRLGVARLAPQGCYCAWDSFLLYCGGLGSRSCALFQLPIGTLVSESFMYTHRVQHALVKYRDSVFIFGGKKKEEVLSLCEEYDIHNHTVQSVGRMSNKRYYLAAVLCNDKIYIAGFATSGKGIRNEIEVFNPEAKSFSVITQPHLHMCSSMVGFNFEDTVYFLKPAEVIRFRPGSSAASQHIPPFIKTSCKSCTQPIIYNETVYFLLFSDSGEQVIYAFNPSTWEVQKVATKMV